MNHLNDRRKVRKKKKEKPTNLGFINDGTPEELEDDEEEESEASSGSESGDYEPEGSSSLSTTPEAYQKLRDMINDLESFDKPWIKLSISKLATYKHLDSKLKKKLRNFYYWK